MYLKIHDVATLLEVTVLTEDSTPEDLESSCLLQLSGVVCSNRVHQDFLCCLLMLRLFSLA